MAQVDFGSSRRGVAGTVSRRTPRWSAYEAHSAVYREVLEGRGHGIETARPSVALASAIRRAEVTAAGDDAHPMLR